MSKLLRQKTSWTFRLTESLVPRMDLQGGLCDAAFDIRAAKTDRRTDDPCLPRIGVDRGCGGVEMRTLPGSCR